jgi:phage terminase large subunit GpA-like protein
MRHKKEDIPNDVRAALLPPERYTVSDWAEKNRILLSESAAEPGPWRNTRTPYLKGVMDALSDPDIDKIVFRKPTQVGATEALLNMIGWVVNNDPGPLLLVYPSVDLGRSISAGRVQPMFAACPSLAKLVPNDRDKFALQEMVLPNMRIYVTGANSPANLASRPCRYIFLDEVSKFPKFAGNEADPISLALERQKTFGNKKTYITSTPTVEDDTIMTEEKLCDQRRDYAVPCPLCGTFQFLRFDQVKWQQGLPKDETYSTKVRDTAYYECEHCHGRINDLQKPAMLLAGVWQGDNKLRHPRSVAFRLNGLYSPWITFGGMAEEFVKSKDSYEKLMNWRNSWNGEPMNQIVRDTEAASILVARREDLEPGTVPQGCIALTAAIDVQKTHFWVAVAAWERDGTGYLIYFGQVPSWAELETLLFNTEFSGHRIWRAVIDLGGGEGEDDISRPEEVFGWLRANNRGRGCQVYGVRGSAHRLPSMLKIGKPIDKTPAGKPFPGGMQIIYIDTFQSKDAFFWHLDKAKLGEAGAFYLHKGIDEDFARQITAEEKRKDRRGIEYYHQLRRDNHALDCCSYLFASISPEFYGGLRFLRDAPGLILAQQAAAATKPLVQKGKAPSGNPFTGQGGWRNNNPFLGGRR